jgi:hypothetical protein
MAPPHRCICDVTRALELAPIYACFPLPRTIQLGDTKQRPWPIKSPVWRARERKQLDMMQTLHAR